MEIRAAVTESKGAPFSIEALELDAPRAGEVLVRVAAVGICHTDLIVRDRFPAERRLITYYDFDEIDAAARAAAEGPVVKLVPRV